MPRILLIFLFASLLFLGCEPDYSGITFREVNENGVQARLFQKDNNDPNLLVVVLTGSGGGFIKNQPLFELANKGYDVLSLAYFGVRGLPDKLEEIPLEYINNGLQWAKGQSGLKDRKIVLLGVSRGAELALLYSSKFQNVDGVICYAPGCLVLPEAVFAKKGDSLRSSWTVQGKPVDFAPLPLFDEPKGYVDYRKYITPLIEDGDVLKKAMISVENIRCPLLMLSGSDDLEWPAAQMSQLIEDRMKAHNSRANIRKVIYEQGGHQFFWFGNDLPPRIPTEQGMWIKGTKYRFRLGGTDEGNRKAMVGSQEEVLQFLSNLSTGKGSDKKNFLYEQGAIVRGDTTQKKLSLVFTGDEFADGANHILSVLEKEQTPGSFFFTGNFYRNPAFHSLIQNLESDGHYLGAHSDKHLLYCDWEKRDSLLVSHEEFRQDLKANYGEMEKFGIAREEAFYFLPPYEWYNNQISFWTKEADLQLINITYGTRSHADYTTPDMKHYIGSEAIYQSVVDYEEKRGLNGFILLVHIGTDPARTDKFYDYLEELILMLKDKGYQFQRIDELLQQE